MFIEKIEIGAFGKFSDFSLDFKDGVNVIYGENEAGKSTICAFLYAMFYNLPTSKKRYTLREDLRKKYMPWDKNEIKGKVYFSHEGKRYILSRLIKAEEKDSKHSLFLEDTWEEIKDERYENPGEYFFGVSENVFFRTFYISQLGVEIAGGKNSEITEQLSNLEQSGEEEISYKKITDKLLKKKYSIISVSKTAGKIPDLNKEKAELLKKLAEKKETENSFNEAFSIKKEAEQEKEKLLKQRTELEKSKILAKKYENWKLKKEAEEELEKVNEETEKLKRELSFGEDKLKALEKSMTALDGIDEKTAVTLSELETKNAVLIKKLENIQAKKEKIKELEESLKTTKETGRKTANMSVLLAATVLLLLSVILCIFVSSLFAFGAVLSLILFVLSFLIKGIKKDDKEKLREIAASVQTLQEDIKEETAVRKEQNDAEEKIKEITSLTQIKTSSELFKKISEMKNIDELISSRIRENSYIEENLKRLSDEAERLKEKASISFYPEGVINVPNADTYDIEKAISLISNEIIACEKRIFEAETVSKSFSDNEESTVDIKNRIENIEKEIAELTEIYNATDKALLMLSEAFEELKSNFTPVLSNKVKDAVCAITDGKYENVKVFDDYSLKVSQKGEILDADYLSGGMYDVLYLALRLGISEIISGGKIPVLIMDDTFLQLDDERGKKAAEYIKEKCAEQILFFTCHKSQCNVFGENNNIVNL